MAVKHDSSTDSYTAVNTDTEQVKCVIQPGRANSTTQKSITTKVFPDSGASICLAGPQFLLLFMITLAELIPTKKKITVVGGSLLPCLGWIPVTFTIDNVSTTQPLYICDKVDRIFFSKKACVATYILPAMFPKPTPALKYLESSETTNLNPRAAPFNHELLAVHPTSSTDHKPKVPTLTPANGYRRSPPPRPKNIPFAPVESSVPQLRKYIVDAFASSALDKSPPLPIMKTKKGHIHLQPNAVPYAVHSPIPVPHHEKAIIKALLDLYVERGIIIPVPLGTPVVWCALMVIGRKKDGSPRITVDYQQLNRQCLRETHHTEPPFHLASRIPANTKKTVLDATDSYHSIELDEESQHLTMFITEWGRYMYLRVPQGFFAAGDIFTSRYDDVTKDIANKVKVIDDALLYSTDIENAFWDTWDFLTLCANNGVVINEEKLQFCQDDVEFAGLHVSNDGISPSQTTLAAIANFPAPTDLESARRWFGLVNYVSWAYSLSPIMAPFRDMIKPNTNFYWDEPLAALFEASKQEILKNISEGVKSFELGRRTCLQTDWCKQGLGYLLLQKHCTCQNRNDVRCCPDGWKLIYAGSRFTKDAESRYKPTEGEALAVAWGLEHSRMFTLGCNDLLVSVDHKPLLGIFNDRDLSTIKNPRIQSFKETTLAWRFDIAHNPGKWHKGADAVSRHPAPILAACISD